MHANRFALSVISLCSILAFALALQAADPLPEKQSKDEAPKKVWQQLKPERLVADNTFIYLSVPDVKKLKAAYGHSALQGLLNEDQISTLLASSFSTTQEVYINGDGTRSEAELRRHRDEVDLLLKVIPLLDGHVALAIDGEEFASFLSTGRLPKALLIASLPPGDKGVERQAAIDEIFRKHRTDETQDAHYKDFDGKVGPYAFQRIENQDIGVYETWAFVENLFVYGNGKKVVEDAINRYLNNGTGSLSAHAGYQNAYKEVARDERGEALLYMQASGGSLSVIPGAESATGDPRFAIGVTVGDGDKAPIREKSFLRLIRSSHNTEPCAAVTARFAQNDTLIYTAWQSSIVDEYPMLSALSKVWAAAANRAAQAADDKAPKAEAAFTFEEYMKVLLGVQNEGELLSKLEMFKGELGVIISQVPQPSLKMEKLSDYLDLFQPVFAIEVDIGVPEQNLKQLLSGIEAKTGRTYEKLTVANTSDKLVYFQKEAAPGGEKGDVFPGLFLNIGKPDAKNVPFFAAYSIVDLELDVGKRRRFLLLSDSLNAIKKAVQQSQPSFLRSSLSEDTRFQGLMKSFRDSRFANGYLDLPRMLDVMTAELPHLSRQGLIRNENLSQIPSSNAMRDHLFPLAWANSVTAEKDGMLFEMSSPVGVMPLASVVSAVAWPYYNSQRRQAVSDEVDNKFKRIFLLLHMYAADQDRFPQHLSDLVTAQYTKDLSLFESPFNRGLVKTAQDVDDPAKTNLIFVPGRSLQDEGGLVVLYEKEPTSLITASDGIRLWYHLLTVDGKNGGKRRALPKAALELRLTGRAETINSNLVDVPIEKK